MVLPPLSDGLGRIRTGDLRCVRATSSPLDYEPVTSEADASAGIMLAMAPSGGRDSVGSTRNFQKGRYQRPARTIGIARLASTVSVSPLASAIEPASASPYAVTK
jgi:hypothetical protein